MAGASAVLVVTVAAMLAAAALDPSATRSEPHEAAPAAEGSDGASSSSATGAAAARRDDRPNVVVITTDDQEAASVSRRAMPATTRLLADGGTSFTDYVVSGPLCCPARAVFLTGQYGHNNGVLWNTPGYSELRGKGNTLPVWLRRNGYTTAHVGKYLNLYGAVGGDRDAVAPGWDEWHTILEPVRYYDYTLRVNGGAVRYGKRPSDYLTRVLNRTAVQMIRRHVPRRRPLFLSLDHLAPHASEWVEPPCSRTATPDPRDRNRFADASLPRGPSFNEAGVADKPSFIAARPRLDAGQVRELTREHRCRLASLRAVDRGVREIFRALDAEGELRNTVIVFTSDNGYLAGEHRVPGDKVIPYEETIRAPLLVHAPSRTIGGGTAPRRVGETVANIDLAPTILRLARAAPCSGPGRCRVLDGRSLLGLLRGNAAGWPSGRGILLELERGARRAAPFTPCDYEGIRTGARVYLEHHSSTGREPGFCTPREETELYDLRSDPSQLRNLVPPTPAARGGSLAARLERLRGCAGVAGRDRPVSGRPFCE